MSAHTPGPWAVCETPANEYWRVGETIGYAVPCGQRICDVALINREANARLIAAAPDLLEALQKALPLLARDAHAPDLEWDIAESAAFAAIAKATGEQP
ncbi:MAG TPA: hypothetical protein VFE72_06035 [Lysobacter sp.]|nr:hypothetical protein [Lysobacter sp.]